MLAYRYRSCFPSFRLSPIEPSWTRLFQVALYENTIIQQRNSELIHLKAHFSLLPATRSHSELTLLQIDRSSVPSPFCYITASRPIFSSHPRLLHRTRVHSRLVRPAFRPTTLTLSPSCSRHRRQGLGTSEDGSGYHNCLQGIYVTNFFLALYTPTNVAVYLRIC